MSSDAASGATSSAPELDHNLVVEKAVEAGHTNVVSIADIKKDRQLAHFSYAAINEAGLGPFIATYDGEVFVYDDGHWRGNPHGIQRLRELSQQALRDQHSENVVTELKSRVQSINGVSRGHLGAGPNEIPVSNGVIDFTRWRDDPDDALRDARPEDYILSPLPVGYNPELECPNWRAFVEEVAEDGKADALQEYIGYCLLVNEWRFDRVLLLVGSGSNGKSTFLNVVTQLLGEDNVTGFSLGDLVRSDYHVAEMFGAIANIDADVTGGIGHGGMFKKLTGGDRKISARHPYGRPFDFRPTTKQLYSANKVPDTKEDLDDDAFFRRWLVVEFPNQYTDPDKPGPDKDPDLELELVCELPGILNWALEGLDRLLDRGQFTTEGDLDEKRERWQSWGDTVDKFIDQCIEVGGEQKFTSGEVYNRYTSFCHTVLEQTPESQRTVTDKLKRLDEVQYSRNFRFNGSKQRGFKGFSFSWSAPGVDDTPERIEQSSLGESTSRMAQEDAVEAVLDAIEDVQAEHDDELAPIDELKDRLADDVGRERVGHIVHQLKNQREPPIYEPEEDTVRLT